MKAANIDKNSREYLEGKKNGARHSILLVLVFTVVNLVLLLTESDRYFLFSASIPYYLTAFGMGMDMEAGGSVFTTTALVISGVCLAAYLLSWILSKRKVGWYVVALVLFIIDTVLFVLMALAMNLLTDSIMDLVFHAWVILELCQALIAHTKLKNMPEVVVEEPIPAAAVPVSEEPWNTPGE